MRRSATILLIGTICCATWSPAETAATAEAGKAFAAGPAHGVAGSKLWISRYSGRDRGGDVATAIAVSPDGSRVFVTGWSTNVNGIGDYVTISYDASDGRTLWKRRYDGPGHANDYPDALAVSPDGRRVFVTGSSTGSGSGYDYATIAYDTGSGRQIWVQRYNGPDTYSADAAMAIAMSPDGSKVFVTGDSVESVINDDYATIAYDASTGSQLWVMRYDGPSNGKDIATALVASPDGRTLFVTGSSIGSNGANDYLTIAYDASVGTQMWVSRFAPPQDASGQPRAIGIAPDGSRVFVTGGLSPGGYATVAYDAISGDKLWVTRYRGPAGSASIAYGLGVSPTGSAVFVSGESDGDYATVAYSADTGRRLWATRYQGPAGGADFADALAVTPDGTRLYVTGGSEGLNSGYDYATVGYDAVTGDQVWLSRYNGPGNGGDIAAGLAISPDGSRVFVTGQSSARFAPAYATVAISSA